MGTFLGHIFPGSGFLLMGVWWIIGAWKRYFRCLRAPGNFRFRSSASLDYPGINQGAYAFVVFGTAGILGEIGSGVIAGKLFLTMVQHISANTFFVLTGLVHFVSKRGLPVPDGAEYATLALSFITQGFIFSLHSHPGVSALENHLHILLVLVICSCAATVLMETRFPEQVLFPLFRGVCTVFQGTWFIHIAFSLYVSFPWTKSDHEHQGNHEHQSDPESDHDHESLMLATTLFTWHLIGAVLFMIIVGIHVYRQQKPWAYCRKQVLEESDQVSM